MSTQTAEFFDALAKVLLRCTILGCLLLFFWFGILLVAKGVTSLPELMRVLKQ